MYSFSSRFSVMLFGAQVSPSPGREHCDVVVERRTPNREVLGSIPTRGIVLEQDILIPYSTG